VRTAPRCRSRPRHGRQPHLRQQAAASTCVVGRAASDRDWHPVDVPFLGPRIAIVPPPPPSMASSVGVLATEAPPQPPAVRPPPSALPSAFDPPDAIARLPKRPRESESVSPPSKAARQLNPPASPARSARLALATTTSSPPPRTGAAALQDERRRRPRERASSPGPPCPGPPCPDPDHAVLESLMSAATRAMSRPADAPQMAPTANMDPAVKAVTALSIPPSGAVRADDRADDRAESSPQSATSVAGVPVTESPTPMDVDTKAELLSAQQVAGQDDRPQPGSLSYPGSLQIPGAVPEQAARGMTFPMPTQIQTSPTSSGGKKHKCPYCSTEFTRHHNLKSHLLTHSQEKPYVCTECQMRFRRLHDLKRHGKLHSGEKPHVCLKCDRKFARGDALARHSKGVGGCAGRRASMGSFADGDELDGAMGEGDESTMSGIAYDNDDDEELRRQSLPSMGPQHASGDGYGAHSRSYPSAGPRPAASGLYPPNVNPAQTGAATNSSSSVPNSMASNHTASTGMSSSMPAGGGNAGMYSQSGMTESPKPLSPGLPGHDSSNVARPRSPGLSQQFQQHHMGRRQSELQSPHSGKPRPKLPGLSHPGFAAPGGTAAFSHGRTPSGAQPAGGDSGNMFAQSDPSVWAYIQTLEDKVKLLSEKVLSLDQEVAGLKKQLETRNGA
ncbi:Zinc finger and BTB domain-containing protein 7A, partial [Tolypocladium capitatum]